jgi:hypothetical protein
MIDEPPDAPSVATRASRRTSGHSTLPTISGAPPST